MRNKIIWITLISGLIAWMGCSNKPTAEELFTQAKKYQENQDFQRAINMYEKIIKLYPDGKQTDEAQFMIGFIYANDLKDYEGARNAYHQFLENYSAVTDSGMIVSAKWELENLGKDINEIDALKQVSGGEESGKPAKQE